MVLYLFIYEKKNLHKRIVKLIEMREEFQFLGTTRSLIEIIALGQNTNTQAGGSESFRTWPGLTVGHTIRSLGLRAPSRL